MIFVGQSVGWRNSFLFSSCQTPHLRWPTRRAYNLLNESETMCMLLSVTDLYLFSSIPISFAKRNDSRLPRFRIQGRAHTTTTNFADVSGLRAAFTQTSSQVKCFPLWFICVSRPAETYLDLLACVCVWFDDSVPNGFGLFLQAKPKRISTWSSPTPEEEWERML